MRGTVLTKYIPISLLGTPFPLSEIDEVNAGLTSCLSHHTSR